MSEVGIIVEVDGTAAQVHSAPLLKLVRTMEKVELGAINYDWLLNVHESRM